MAHLIRPWQVRYEDAKGRRVPKGTPGAKRIRQRARKWYGAGIPGNDADGKPYGKRRVPLASDKNVARQLLADRVLKAERGEAHLEDKATEAARMPLKEHLDGFEAFLRSSPKGITDKQVKQNLQRIRAVLDGCCFTHPGDIDADRVAEYLAGRRGLPRKEGGISTRTSNFYMKAVRQFCRWMCHPKRRYLLFNPLADAEVGHAEADLRHARRDLKPDELVMLLDATGNSAKAFRGLTGPERRLLYLAACGTGFRRSELVSLTPASFDLDADPPTATVARAYVKNRRTVKKTIRQPLPAAVAEALRPFLQGRPPGVPVWAGNWWTKSADMLKLDLEAASVPYVVQGPDGPLYADFHGLRHTYISLMERAGVGMNDAKELARHSTIILTKDRYTHADGAGLAAAVNKLALPGAAAPLHLKDFDPFQLLALLAVAWTALGVLLGDSLVARRVAPDSESEPDTRGPNRTAE